MLVLTGAVALLARHKHHFLAAVGQFQPLEFQILEFHLHRRAGMHLQGQHPLRRPLARLGVDHFRHQLAVDEVRDLRALGHDPVFVPIGWLDDLLQVFTDADFFRRLLLAVGGDRHPLPPLGQNAAPLLLIENARVGGAGVDIGLIAADDKIAVIFAAVLHAAVAAGDPVFQPQFKVVERALPPDEEGVSLGRILGRRLPDDGAILHRPELRLPLPALQACAVEDRHEAGISRRRLGRGGGAETTDCHQGHGQQAAAQPLASHPPGCRIADTETIPHTRCYHRPPPRL